MVRCNQDLLGFDNDIELKVKRAGVASNVQVSNQSETRFGKIKSAVQSMPRKTL